MLWLLLSPTGRIWAATHLPLSSSSLPASCRDLRRVGFTRVPSSWAVGLAPSLPSSSEGMQLCQNPTLLLSSAPASPAWCSEISPPCFPDWYQAPCGGFLDNIIPGISGQLTARCLHCFSPGRFGMAAQLLHSTSLRQPGTYSEHMPKKTHSEQHHNPASLIFTYIFLDRGTEMPWGHQQKHSSHKIVIESFVLTTMK